MPRLEGSNFERPDPTIVGHLDHGEEMAAIDRHFAGEPDPRFTTERLEATP